VTILPVFPGVQAETWQAINEIRLKCGVMSYGAGNAPDPKHRRLRFYRSQQARDVSGIVNVSQCGAGRVAAVAMRRFGIGFKAAFISGEDHDYEHVVCEIAFSNWVRVKC